MALDKPTTSVCCEKYIAKILTVVAKRDLVSLTYLAFACYICMHFANTLFLIYCMLTHVL